MFDEKFRRLLAKSSLVKRLISGLIRRNITPNQLTVSALFSAIAASFLLAIDLEFYSLGFWFFGRFLDGLDGILARETGQKTGFGGYLDLLLDMLAYGLYLFAFAYKYQEYQLLWFLILLAYLLCVTSTLSLGSLLENLSSKGKELKKTTNRSFWFTVGIAEAGETSVAYTLFILFPGFILYLGIFWLILVCLTVIQRSYLASKC